LKLILQNIWKNYKKGTKIPKSIIKEYERYQQEWSDLRKKLQSVDRHTSASLNRKGETPELKKIEQSITEMEAFFEELIKLPSQLENEQLKLDIDNLKA